MGTGRRPPSQTPSLVSQEGGRGGEGESPGRKTSPFCSKRDLPREQEHIFGNTPNTPPHLVFVFSVARFPEQGRPFRWFPPPQRYALFAVPAPPYSGCSESPASPRGTQLSLPRLNHQPRLPQTSEGEPSSRPLAYFQPRMEAPLFSYKC